MPDFDLLYLAGSSANVLTRALSVTPNDADALFPIERLFNGHPDEIFRWGSNGADRLWTADGCLVADPGFEDTALANWTDIDSGDGVSSRDTAVKQSGAASLKLVVTSSGVAGRRQYVTVRPGERIRLEVVIRQDGTGSVQVRVRNLQTGSYLTSAGTWQAAVAYAAQTTADTAAAFSAQSAQGQVEVAAGLTEMTLEVVVSTSSAGVTGYVDDLAIVPAINFLSLHGDNVAPVVAPELRSSTDGFGAVDTLEATLTPQHPSYFAYLTTPVYRRYWRLKLSGTNPETPRAGAAVLGYAELLGAHRGWGYETSYVSDQVRNRAPGGRQSVTALGGARRRVVRWGLPVYDESEFLEVRDDVYERSGYGVEPVVFAALDSDTDQTIIHGRLTDRLDVSRAFLEAWSQQVLLEEDPFPIVLE